jgi:hypothetical protein
VRSPRENEDRVDITPTAIHQLYLNRIESLQHILAKRLDNVSDLAVHEILTKDSTETALPAESVDFVLTSPPYCTRIDYVAATKIELAILHFLCRNNWQNLSRRMLGTTRVCAINAEPEGEWGPTCIDFLTKMRGHHSKASASYYFKTHLDYFQKLHRSLSVISRAMKRRALGIFVVQGSYYKEIHNDLPRILSEMASSQHLELKRREDFFSSRSMSVVNPNSRRYKRDSGAVESVLCFTKI